MKPITKVFILFFILLSCSELIMGQVSVRGYTRKDGTNVRPHVRSNPDGDPLNNWSYPGNTNPYTGKTATGNPDTYLRNYYNSPNSTTKFSKSNNNSDVNWEEVSRKSDKFWKDEYPKIKAEQDKFWKDEYPKIKAEQDRFIKDQLPKIKKESDALFTSSSNNYLSKNTFNSSVDGSINYHFKYTIEDRKNIELALQKLGYYIGVADGTFDEETIRGVKNFQEDSGEVPDGKIGPRALSKIISRLKFN